MKKLEFNDTDLLAEKWWPLGRNKPVLWDPHRRFGAPICAVSGVPTHLIWQTKQAGEPYEEVADWYGASLSEVKAACQFEKPRLAIT